MLSYQKQIGYSLVELIITILLSSIALIIFFNFFASNQKKSVAPVFQIKATKLAQAYLEEIQLKRYDENSPAGNSLRCNSPTASACSTTLTSDGESRSGFDDVDDYNGLNDSPPQDVLGNNRADFNRFSVSVAVSYAGTDLGLALQDMKRIQVTVTAPDNSQYVFSQYKGNF
jgi:MSHA pilin protein MshD